MLFKNRSQWGLVFTILVGLGACTNNDIDPTGGSTATPTKGSADFTKYVAVGNSLTAGYADGGLYRDSQINSYPNILAGQFALVGGGSFVQPLFTEAQAAGSGYLKLIKVPSPTDPSSLLSSIGQVAPGAARGGFAAGNIPLMTKFTDANQNLGVPGIRVSDILTPNYGSTQGNAYFERLIANPLTTYFQYMSDNLSGATFFSCWLGNNDALGYATSGGDTPLTPTALFTTNFTAAMNKLTEGGRKGVVIGIPTITTSPYFTTLPLSLVLAQLNLVLRPTTPLTALVIQTANGVRATQTGDLLMLSNALDYANIGSTSVGTKVGPYGLSITNPLPNKIVLDAGEVTALNAAISTYNGIMKAQADAKGTAYVDPNTILNQIGSGTGISQNGVTYTSSFIQGGVFSLDGIHLTPAGYALMANEIIKGINAKYGSTIPAVNPANYRRVLLQQ
ncbi:SGNH/GDSL hydrolase family protein [Spirosoma sp.]|uniref:SGNH/GDSL hydrolase family protein n=1 Tax=Spirosoma sp. TaxID=1899569 RepID=UPI0026131835|nr:SGNH/GDSL hydrolase family protein [Spirosoma sp.]MCX6218160.1 SGNH/GDSL hydrolase family protein [Spirosoma sp.]